MSFTAEARRDCDSWSVTLGLCGEGWEGRGLGVRGGWRGGISRNLALDGGTDGLLFGV